MEITKPKRGRPWGSRNKNRPKSSLDERTVAYNPFLQILADKNLKELKIEFEPEKQAFFIDVKAEPQEAAKPMLESIGVWLHSVMRLRQSEQK